MTTYGARPATTKLASAAQALRTSRVVRGKLHALTSSTFLSSSTWLVRTKTLVACLIASLSRLRMALKPSMKKWRALSTSVTFALLSLKTQVPVTSMTLWTFELSTLRTVSRSLSKAQAYRILSPCTIWISGKPSQRQREWIFTCSGKRRRKTVVNSPSPSGIKIHLASVRELPTLLPKKRILTM